ncbi:MAG: DMT family transporter [Candidatus Helarchaeota archaeon]|nr:DMT family transporter [Candidatus Helarchaeota archaeon]
MVISVESKGYILVFFAVFIWSFGEILIKLLQNSVGPFAYPFLRFFIGSLFLFSVLGIKKDFSGIKDIMKNPVLILLASVLGLGISHVLFFIGISKTFANTGSLIFTTYPIWTALYSIILLNERTNLKLKFIGMGIGIFGIAILMLSFQPTEFFNIEQFFKNYSHLLGSILALIASFFWSLYAVLGKKIQNKCEENKETSNYDLKFTALSFIVTSIAMLFLLIFTPDFEAIFHYDLNTWILVLILGVVSSGVSYYLFFMGVRYIEVSKGISLALLKPIIAIFFAFVILGEDITLILLFSLGIVIFSLYLINKNISENEKE